MTVPELLGKPIGEDGLAFLRKASENMRASLPVEDQELCAKLMHHLNSANTAIERMTDGTQSITTGMFSQILGMLPENLRMACLADGLELGEELGKSYSAAEVNEFANAAEPEPAEPIGGVLPLLTAQEGPAPGPPPVVHRGVDFGEDLGAHGVEARVSTLVLEDYQAEANRLGKDGWRVVAQSPIEQNGIQAVIVAFQRSLRSDKSRRDDRTGETQGNAATDQRGPADGGQGQEARGGSGRAGRVSLPVVR